MKKFIRKKLNKKLSEEKGVMTIEATIVLTTMMFFVLFIMNFGMIYRAQNYMIHSIYQTSKCVSFASHRYSIQSTDTNIVDSFMNYFGFISEDNALRLKWRKDDYVGTVEDTFYKGITDAENLKKYGLENIKFEVKLLRVDTHQNDLQINVVYDVDLPYKLFGLDKITLHHEVLTGLWEKENMDSI